MNHELDYNEVAEALKITLLQARVIVLVVEESYYGNVMENLDALQIPGCHGIERLRDAGEFICEYLNTGDTYSSTEMKSFASQPGAMNTRSGSRNTAGKTM